MEVAGPVLRAIPEPLSVARGHLPGGLFPCPGGRASWYGTERKGASHL